MKSSYCTMLVALTCLLCSFTLSGQTKNVKDTSLGVFMVGLGYSGYVPSADFGKRFGYTSTVSSTLMRKTSANHLFALRYQFMFGGRVVEENPLRNISTSNGFVISPTGQYNIIETQQRGHIALFQVGHVFKMPNKNPNSGPFVALGGGYIEHRIKYYIPGNLTSPQLQGNYLKGYDRYTNGPATSLSAGFLNLSKSHLVNFTLAFEVIAGFTKSRRSYNFDTGLPDNNSRLDLLYGISASWYFPFYGKSSDGYYYQ